jgi:RNA polymerase sigma factor (sigma-70 family)
MDGQQPPNTNELWGKIRATIEAFAVETWQRFPWTELDDLKQAGWEAYLKALPTYDPAKGVAVSTYVAKPIYYAMCDLGRDGARWRRAEFAAATRVSEDNQQPARRLKTTRIKRSMSAFIRLSTVIAEPVPDPETLCANEDALQKLRQQLDALPPPERRVIDLLLQDRSNGEIATTLDVDKSTASRKRDAAINLLRSALLPPDEAG